MVDFLEILVCIVFLVFAILQIILFFNVWGMTNNIRKIKDKYLEAELSSKYPGKIPGSNSRFKEDDLVVLIASGRQMRVKRITNNGYFSCYANNGTVHVGDFREDELKLFNE